MVRLRQQWEASPAHKAVLIFDSSSQANLKMAPAAQKIFFWGLAFSNYWVSYPILLELWYNSKWVLNYGKIIDEKVFDILGSS